MFYVELLYDPDTTIASLASIIYKQVRNDNPFILTKLSITCDIDQIDDDDIKTNCDDSNTANDHLSSAASTITTTTTQSLARVILHNRALVDGYRGIAISLVLIEHLTRHNSFIIYLHVDEKIFIMITGFMLALQELLTIETSSLLSSNNNTSKIENTSKFLPLAWLRSRAIGLFPLYWVALLLNIPRFYTNVVGSEELNLNQIQLFWYIVVHTFALQDWSLKWSNNINIYYISLIWNVFIIYACYKSIYFSNYNYLFKFIGFTTITLFLILLDIYYNHIEIGLKSILSPQWGFVYFTVGFLAALLFSWFYKSEYWKLFLLKSAVKTQEEYDSVLLMEQNGDDDTYVHNEQLRKVSLLSSWPSSLRDYDNNRYLQYRNIPSYATDFLAAIFIILVFTSPGGDNKNVATAMVFFVLPLLFLALLVTSFLQPIKKTTTTSSSLPLLQSSSSSFFTRLASTRLFVTMGQSSLAIYMFHNILIFYYYNNVIIAGQNHYHHSPYTRKFVSKYNHDGNNLQFKNGAYDFIAFLIVIPFGIFMQKIIQDRLIPLLINHIEVLYQKKIYYGSSNEIITEQNNVVLEKKIDVDKDI
jgi:hypothetical protein